jgi:hypothetical protein
MGCVGNSQLMCTEPAIRNRNPVQFYGLVAARPHDEIVGEMLVAGKPGMNIAIDLNCSVLNTFSGFSEITTFGFKKYLRFF